jgi:hypothetical protein
LPLALLDPFFKGLDRKQYYSTALLEPMQIFFQIPPHHQVADLTLGNPEKVWRLLRAYKEGAWLLLHSSTANPSLQITSKDRIRPAHIQGTHQFLDQSVGYVSVPQGGADGTVTQKYLQGAEYFFTAENDREGLGPFGMGNILDDLRSFQGNGVEKLEGVDIDVLRGR